MSPRFTVLIPTYRRAQVLERAIASVLAQSYGDFELVVVDDASPDTTREVVMRIEDPRVRYVRQETNRGVSAARNRGVAEARARIVALLDDDDEYLPTFLEKTDRVFLEDPSIGFTWAGVRWIRDSEDGPSRVIREGLWLPSFANREAAYLGFLANRQIGTNCGLCFRREAFDRAGGFDESLSSAEDTDFLVRLAREADYRVVREVLVQVHLHGGGSLRSDSADKARVYEALLEKHREVLEDHPRLKAQLVYKVAWLSYHAGSRRDGRRHLLSAIRQRPTFLKAWLCFVVFETLGSLAPEVHRRLSELRRGRRRLGV